MFDDSVVLVLRADDPIAILHQPVKIFVRESGPKPTFSSPITVVEPDKSPIKIL